MLTNVARHANATKVNAFMRLSADTLTLEVQDNGKGITPAELLNPKSLGLLGMRERVLPFDGRIKINGIRSKGTQVMVSVPLRPDRV